MTAPAIQSKTKTDLVSVLVEVVGERAQSAALEGPVGELLSTNHNLERCLRLLALPEKTWGSLSGVYEILKVELRPMSWRELASLDTTTEELARFRRRLSARRGKVSALSEWPSARREPAPDPSS
jgi:hypothetical protein